MTNQEFIESISLPNEEWRDVVGFEGRYAVSSFGRVITFGFHNCGRVPKKNFSPKILKTDLARGYLRLCLYKNNKQYKKVVHRLVAEGFKSSAISDVCAGRSKTHKGLRWFYLSDYETLNQ